MSKDSVLFELREQAKNHASTDTPIVIQTENILSTATSGTISLQGGDSRTGKIQGKEQEKPSRLLNRAKRAITVPLTLEEVMAIGKELEGNQLAAFRAISSSTSLSSSFSSLSSTSSSASTVESSKSMEVENAAKAAMEAYTKLASPPSSSSSSSSSSSTAAHKSSVSEISVLCRTAQQVTAACQLSYIKEITLDFLEVHGLREAVQEIKKAGKIAVVATPRIIKPNEERLYTFYLRLKADALLVRSAGFLNQLLELGGAGSVLSTSNITIPDLRGLVVSSFLLLFSPFFSLLFYSSLFFFSRFFSFFSSLFLLLLLLLYFLYFSCHLKCFISSYLINYPITFYHTLSILVTCNLI